MDLGLAGKIALVTGASRGLGRAIALALAEEGMDVVLTARNQELLDAVAHEIEAMGRRALVCLADLREEPAAAKTVAAGMAKFGRLDLLVNNAGATKRGDFLKLTDADWADGFALKFFGHVRMSRAAWPHLQETKGSIINIAGNGGRTAGSEFTIGGSVNAALALLTKALADRGVADGVRVNAVHPGVFETERFQARVQNYSSAHKVSPEEAYRRMLAEHRIARFGRPEEVGRLVAMMASGRLGHLQGAVIDFDGGETRAV
jgi:NAD(P)-dependent dehydrogenase (short-subunit alcohol dehydrogenase family)